MAKNLDITDINVVTQIISDIQGGEDIQRKKDSFDDWQIYSGNTYPYVNREIVATRPKSYEGYSISDISFSRVITTTKSKAYKEQPIRSLGSDQTKNERLHDIYNEAGAKRQLPFMDTITNLHKHSLLWVNNRDEDEKYQFMALQGFEYSVVRDKDTGELICVILNYGNLDITAGAQTGDGIDNLIAESQADSSAQSKIYAMWSKDNYVVVKVELSRVMTTTGEQVKKSVTFVDIPDNPNNENKIGILPFVYVSQETAIDYPTRNPLGTQTINANVLMSEYFSASKIQGVGQMIIKYPEKFENAFKRLTTGLLSAIKLPQSSNPDDSDTDVSYISPSPDLSGQKDAIILYLKQMLNEHGIKNTSSIDSGGEDFNSGVQMAIANASVQDIIEENQLLYTSVEEQVFEIIKAWEDFRGNSVFSEDDELTVVFKKPKVLISDAEVLANVEKRLSLGLMEKWEALMVLDPNLTEQKAREKIEEIQKTSMQSLQGLSFGNREDNQEPQA